KLDAYVVLLRLRHDLFLKWKETGKWPDDKDANRALAAHGEYWEKQLGEGHALLAGGMKGDYWDNVALIVFEAESEAKAKEIVPVQESAQRTSIHVDRSTALLGVRVRGGYLLLTIKSDRSIDSPSIYKTEQTSKSRHHHEVKLSSPGEIDAELLGWLEEAYA